MLSTVNVQHLESLNDHITELSGVRVRETIPDAVLGSADEVVLIDLTPEALLDRLRAGKIYPAERVDAALNNFFRIENLSALREVALRLLAEEVGAKRLTSELTGSREESLAADAPQAVGERLLALIEPNPRAQRLVRRAWRSAQRLGAELDLLWVRPPGGSLSEEQERSLAAISQLASVLGARMMEEESDDLALSIKDVAERRGSTYILLGYSAPRARTGAAAGASAAAADGAAAGRRCADRRRPLAQDQRGGPMSAWTIFAIAAAGMLLGIGAGYWLPPHGRLAYRERPRPVRQILLPFSGQQISRRAFEAAVRLAKAEDATIMPAFLATVPMNLPLESALPLQCARGMPLLEAIEQRAASQGVSGGLASRPGPFGSRRPAQTDRSRELRPDHCLRR